MRGRKEMSLMGLKSGWLSKATGQLWTVNMKRCILRVQLFLLYLKKIKHLQNRVLHSLLKLNMLIFIPDGQQSQWVTALNRRPEQQGHTAHLHLFLNTVGSNHQKYFTKHRKSSLTLQKWNGNFWLQPKETSPLERTNARFQSKAGCV